MLRRRTLDAPSPEPAARRTAVDARSLAAAGWVLPRALEAGTDPRWTLVGTVGSPTATPVDPTGLVVGDGWSLDWWIGADDRWHLPVREAAVRQQRLDDAPVIETRLRIPGGDAVHRAYGIRTPRPGGDEWVVAEIENATPVPFAVALVIRPILAGALADVGHITLEKVRGGKGRDGAHLARVDGVPALVLPRLPSRFVAGNLAEGDVVGPVTEGAALADAIDASCPDGLATLALVYPLPHTAVLRVLLPVGEGVGPDPIDYPAVVPDAATVAAGWDVHRRGPRFDVPDRRLAESLRAARAQVQLAHDGTVVRRDGRRAPDREPGATEVILGALDLLDRPDDVDRVVARWADVTETPSPEVDIAVLESVARHELLHRSAAVFEWLLPEVSAAVQRIDRAERRGRLDAPVTRGRAKVALGLAAQALRVAGQPDAGRAVDELAARFDDTPAVEPPDLAATLAALATPWGQDSAAAALIVQLGRSLLVSEDGEGLALLPTFPDGWYGAGIELHDAPTAWGRLSFAVRWHGSRPALLWDLSPHLGQGPTRLIAPGLDPSWSTTEIRGDALLAEVAPPADLDLVTVVAEHPDIDPAMRRPGADPGPVTGDLPEGGSFS